MNRSARGHRFAQENLSAYFDGELSERDTRRVEAHLARCAQCRQELADLEMTVNLAAELPLVPLPKSFVLPPSAQPVQKAHRRWSMAFSYLRGATAAIALLLAFFVAGDAALRMASLSAPVAVQESAPAPMMMEREIAEAPVAQEAAEAPAPTLVAEKAVLEKEVATERVAESQAATGPTSEPAAGFASKVAAKGEPEGISNVVPDGVAVLESPPEAAPMVAPRAQAPQPAPGSLDALDAPRGGVGGGGGETTRAMPPAPMTTGARPVEQPKGEDAAPEAATDEGAPVAKVAVAEQGAKAPAAKAPAAAAPQPTPTALVCAAEAAEQAESKGSEQAPTAAPQAKAVPVQPTAAPAVEAPAAQGSSTNAPGVPDDGQTYGTHQQPPASGDPVMSRLGTVARAGSVILLGVLLVMVAALVVAGKKSRA